MLMWAIGGRKNGLPLSASTTRMNRILEVAMPTELQFRLLSGLRVRHHLRQLLQTDQIVNRQEFVGMRQRRLDPSRKRFVTGRTQQGVQPDQTMTAALQAPHLLPQQLRITPSQPSLITRTIAPCPQTRRAQSKLKARIASPMRVPPAQSRTASAV